MNKVTIENALEVIQKFYEDNQDLLKEVEMDHFFVDDMIPQLEIYLEDYYSGLDIEYTSQHKLSDKQIGVIS